MTSFEVTVVIASYNFSYPKMMGTLRSVLKQRDVDLEIIIADDGSQNADYTEVERYIHEIGFESFFLVRNKQNQGTVKNIISGLRRARGKYVYITSPGDMLFDDRVLHDFYEYAEESGAKLLFGDAVYYNTDGGLTLYDDKSAPIRPYCYGADKSPEFKKAAFFFGGYILGAAFFRDTETAKKYFGIIENCCKFVEDNTSTAFMLADGVKVEYFHRNMIWYEYGGGVSTSKENKWKAILDNDFKESFILLKKHHPNDKIIDAAYEKNVNGKGKGAVALKHPKVMLDAFRYKLSGKRKVGYTDTDKARLEKLLKD